MIRVERMTVAECDKCGMKKTHEGEAGVDISGWFMVEIKELEKLSRKILSEKLYCPKCMQSLGLLK